MSATFSAPNPEHEPTRAEHEVLQRYLAGWARAVLPRRGQTHAEGAGEPRLLYVEACAAGARGAFGGAGFETALGAVALLEHAAPRAAIPPAVVLVEEDPEQVRRLVAALAARGLGGRLSIGEEATLPAPGGIRVVQAPWATVGATLGAHCADAGRALLFLDPPAAAAVPLAALAPWLASGRADVLLRFPATDFERFSRYRGTPLADLPPHGRRLLHALSALLGDARHDWLAGWRAPQAAGAEAAGAAMLRLYGKRLRAAGAAVVKPVMATDAAGEPLPLVLATPEPERALLLNRVVHEARVAGRLRWPEAEPTDDLVRLEESGVLDLFGAAMPGARVRRADLAELAERLTARWAGRTLPFREVLAALAESALFAEEVRRALGLLKQAGRAAYTGLAAEAEVRFAPAGVTLPRERRPRAARQALELEIEDGSGS